MAQCRSKSRRLLIFHPPQTKGKMKTLIEIANRLKTQGNRMTSNPMFCVQIKVRVVGMDTAYSVGKCWHDYASQETLYDDDPEWKNHDGDEWNEFGYVDRWETVMVAFTGEGCNQFMELDGHNVKRRAFRGEVRIYVESFNRCPEMIAIREYLLSLATVKDS